MHVLVMAKAPVPGRVKTRLCPPCSPRQAARLAAAALTDTLTAALACRAAERVVLALDGDLTAWPAGVTVIAQRGATFAERLANAWADAGGPGIQIGMDTPQVTPALLDRAAADLLAPGTDAVFGRALDGGWWAIGMRRPTPAVFEGVPMSRSDTGRRQRGRLRSLGWHVTELAPLQDVDTFADARAVAAAAPGTAFARYLASLRPLAEALPA